MLKSWRLLSLLLARAALGDLSCTSSGCSWHCDDTKQRRRGHCQVSLMNAQRSNFKSPWFTASNGHRLRFRFKGDVELLATAEGLPAWLSIWKSREADWAAGVVLLPATAIMLRFQSNVSGSVAEILDHPGQQAPESHGQRLATPDWSPWTRVDFTHGPSARRWHTAVLSGWKMWIFGGNDGQLKNDLWSYDMLTDRWLEGAMNGLWPAPRFSHMAVMQDHLMWVFGGVVLSGLSNELWTYDVELGNWTTWSHLEGPTARESMTLVNGDGKLWMFGGYDGSLRNDLWCLTTGLEPAWTLVVSVGSLPSGRYSHVAVQENGKMWVFGGLTPAGLNKELWYFNLASFQWTEVNTPDGPSARESATAVSDPGQLWLFGGIDAQKQSDEVWLLDFEGEEGAASWQLLDAGGGPNGRRYHVAVFDPWGRMWCHNGELWYFETRTSTSTSSKTATTTSSSTSATTTATTTSSTTSTSTRSSTSTITTSTTVSSTTSSLTSTTTSSSTSSTTSTTSSSSSVTTTTTSSSTSSVTSTTTSTSSLTSTSTSSSTSTTSLTTTTTSSSTTTTSSSSTSSTTLTTTTTSSITTTTTSSSTSSTTLTTTTTSSITTTTTSSSTSSKTSTTTTSSTTSTSSSSTSTTISSSTTTSRTSSSTSSSKSSTSTSSTTTSRSSMGFTSTSGETHTMTTTTEVPSLDEVLGSFLLSQVTEALSSSSTGGDGTDDAALTSFRSEEPEAEFTVSVVSFDSRSGRVTNQTNVPLVVPPFAAAGDRPVLASMAIQSLELPGVEVPEVGAGVDSVTGKVRVLAAPLVQISLLDSELQVVETNLSQPLIFRVSEDSFDGATCSFLTDQGWSEDGVRFASREEILKAFGKGADASGTWCATSHLSVFGVLRPCSFKETLQREKKCFDVPSFGALIGSSCLCLCCGFCGCYTTVKSRHVVGGKMKLADVQGSSHEVPFQVKRPGPLDSQGGRDPDSFDGVADSKTLITWKVERLERLESAEGGPQPQQIAAQLRSPKKRRINVTKQFFRETNPAVQLPRSGTMLSMQSFQDVSSEAAIMAAASPEMASSSQCFEAFEVGAAVEFFSETHGKWTAGFIKSQGQVVQALDLPSYHVHLSGGQLRPFTTLERLRPPFGEGEVVSAEVDQHWRPATVLSRHVRAHGHPLSYGVQLENSEIHVLTGEQIRCRYVPGDQVVAFQGIRIGWVQLVVQAESEETWPFILVSQEGQEAIPILHFLIRPSTKMLGCSTESVEM